jgi:hypothetical protein
MRAAETPSSRAQSPTHYLVGTPRGRLSQMEQDFVGKPWAQVRDAVQVKLVEQDGELYILARSGARRDKAMRRRLKKLVKRLHELRQQKLTRDQLLIKLGAARKEAGPAAWRIIDLLLPEKDEAHARDVRLSPELQTLREARRREGSYLLRSNLIGGDPAQLWTFYLQLTEVDIDQSWRLSRIKGCVGSRRLAAASDAGAAALPGSSSSWQSWPRRP